MLEPKRFDRIACGLAMTVALLMGSTFATWAQGPRSETRTNPPAAPSGNAVSTVLTLVVLAALVIAIVVVAKYVAPNRKQVEEAVILQSQLTDAIFREARSMAW